MDNLLKVLPLAVVMIAGPQIITAIMLATSEKALRNSYAYVGGAMGGPPGAPGHVMGRRAETVLPALRNWMNAHAWGGQ